MIDLISKIKKKDVIIPNEFSDILSLDCKDLLFNLLKKNPQNRIDWNNFFNHTWFLDDELLLKENKLMEISMNKSLPPKNESTIFYNSNLFKHKSIQDSLKENETQFKMSISDDEGDISIYLTDSHNNSEESDEEIFKSLDNINQSEITRTVSKPVNIDSNMFLSRQKSYEIIERDEYKYMSAPVNYQESPSSLSDSLKHALNTSIDILRMSYNYFTTKTI